MVARPYIARKYLYTDDFGRETIKIQREFLNPDTNEPLVPITAKFQEREFDIPEKAETNFNGEQQRHFLAFVDVGNGANNAVQFKQFIPFNVAQDITQQIQEINTRDNVICGDYNGENSGNQRILNQ